VEAALAAFAREFPDAIRGSELDLEANVHRLEQICSRAEQLTGSDEASSDSSPAAILAKQLREALAANTIGGRVDPESRRRELEHEARELQAAWARVGFVPDAVAKPLVDRFRKALRRALESGGRDRHDVRRRETVR
jgi:hypothetical protein